MYRTGRRRVLASLALATTVWASTASPAAAQVADVTPPPTPGAVTAVDTTSALDPRFTAFDGEIAGIETFSASVNAAATAAAAHDGLTGLRLSSVQAPGYARWNAGTIEGGHSQASVRFWVRLESRGAGQSVDLMTVTNTEGVRNFDFFITGDTQRFKWDIYNSSAGESGFVVEPGRWYFIEARVSFSGGLHTAEVRIDGIDQDTVLSPGVDTRVRAVIVGSHGAKTHTQDYDDIAVVVGDTAAPWGFAPATVPGVQVSWEPVADGELGLREYEIWRNGSWYGWVPASATAFTDTNPVPGSYYQIRAVDQALNRSGWSSRAFVGVTEPDVLAPATPQAPTLTPQPDGSLAVGWQAVTDDGGSGLREYAIWRNGSWYGWVPATATSFVDPAPVPGASYQISAYDNALNQSARSVASVWAPV
ncbi:MAG: fibronectin type III domain-containing protein [Acidimicrobiales bacterium]|nr:fibronectin type III domain-containing protein [Acidimicrobiales bacterium]